MIKILKIIIILLSVITLSSCSKAIIDFFPSRAAGEMTPDPDASPDFKKGWQDGCETGMSAGSNTFYKSFYDSNKVDGWKMQNSKDYKTAWNNSFWFCYRFDYFKQKSSIWGSFFSGYR